MEKYLIQAYSRDMKEMLWQEDKEFELTGDAMLDACSKASCNAIVCLWIRSERDPNRLWLIAKFYGEFWRKCLKRAKRYWAMDPDRLDKIQDGVIEDVNEEED